MFASHSLTVSQPAERVAALLSDPAHPWTVGLDGDGRELLAKVGIEIGGLPLYKHVQLTIRAPSGTEATGKLMLPVGWAVVGGQPVFPGMEGTIHIQPEGAGTCRLVLNASYDPPLGRLGELIDRALMHRVAAATMRDFLERVAARLEAELAAQIRPGVGEPPPESQSPVQAM